MWHKILFGINPQYQAVLDRAGVNDFKSLMFEAAGESIFQKPRNEVLRLRLPGPTGETVCYLKRTWREKMRHAWQMTLRGTWPHVEAYREMQGITALRRAGFSTMNVMAWGEQWRWTLPGRGFILSEAVAGEDAQKLFLSGSAESRRAILTTLGRLHAELNAAGFFQAVRFKDVFVRPSEHADRTHDTTLIDRSALWVWPKRFTPPRCRSSLSRTARRLRNNLVHLNAEEATVYAEAYVRAIAPRWTVPAHHVRDLMLVPETGAAGS